MDQNWGILHDFTMNNGATMVYLHDIFGNHGTLSGNARGFGASWWSVSLEGEVVGECREL
jgi:hypothetical protein